MRPGWRWLAPVFCGFGLFAPVLLAQARLDVPSITAAAKGPDQINLAWRGSSNPGYGYVVEIQSGADERYRTWRELRPIAPAAGYICNNSVVIRNNRCNISDPSGAHVYHPPDNGIPYWVTEPNYIDPQDDSPAQFIAWGLKPNTSYSFRVRSYSGRTFAEHSPYSNIATAATAAYELRYASPGGKDSNDGKTPEPAHAWKTLAHASAALACGQELIVLGGAYAEDAIKMNQACSAARKAVVMVRPGDDAVIASLPPGGQHAIDLGGSYLVIDGLKLASSTLTDDYDVQITGNRIALLNVEAHPAVIPTFRGMVHVRGGHNLIYRCYLHDAGSPDANQNPSGNGGFVLTAEGAGAAGNVFWSNHFTRGGHDDSLCIRGANHNRWLNNVMDGGWGMGWNAIQGSEYNLFEGNFIYDPGQLVSFYKPAVQVSSGNNTVRRNIAVHPKTNGLEVSALYGGENTNHARIYNNLFYAPRACYFQSRNGGVAAYDDVIYENNVCYKFTDFGTDIYLGNRTGHISYNTFLPVDDAGAVQLNKPVITWNHSGAGAFQYPRPLSYADSNYKPPFSDNVRLAIEARFVDESRLDFHLSAGSGLIGQGGPIDDKDWGSVSGRPDLGPFGIGPVTHPAAFVPVGSVASATAVEAGPPAANAAPEGGRAAPAKTEKAPRFGVGELDRPTLTCIGIRLPVAADLSYKALVTVRYREAGGSRWRDALPLFRVHPDVVTGLDVQPHFGGTIFDLEPGSKYEIELRMVDPESGVDQRATISASTRSVPQGPTAPHERPVQSTQELKSALASARPGDIIELANGIYSGPFQVSAAGTSENPVVIRGASEEGAILDGNGCTGCNVLDVSGAGHLYIENLTIRNAERAIRFQTNGAEGNVVRRVHIRDTTIGISSHPDQKDFYICDNTLEGRLKFPLMYKADNGAHSNDDGIQVMGFGHVVCHNRISGFGDAMKTQQRGARAVDFYGNDIRYTYDNGVELDEGAGNIRCFRNRFFNTYATLSVQPIYGGPAYMVRNVVVNVMDEQMKFHALGGNPPQEPSGIFALHNTFVSPHLALTVQTPAMSHFFLVANNLFVGPESPGMTKVVDWDAPVETGVFDYNAYFPDGIFHFNLWKESTKDFPGLASLRSRGFETHGVVLRDPVFRNGFGIERDAAVFVQPVDVALAPGSPAIDHAVYLPNINGDFTGAGPDIGAIETGCPAPVYGPRPTGVDETTAPAACPAKADSPAPSFEDGLKLLARMSGAAPPRTALISARTPRAIAEDALLVAASGDLAGAFGMFTAANFPGPRQEDAVREAYFELQLQSLLGLAAARKCPQADDGITNLGHEDKNIPFTFYGFGAFLKRLRTQFLIATVEFSCVGEKAARKRWEKVSKGTADLSSTDYAYPYLALVRLDPEGAKARVAAALAAVKTALASAKPEQRGLLLYHQGLLLTAVGQTNEAISSLVEGAAASSGMLRYLNLEVGRTLEKRGYR